MRARLAFSTTDFFACHSGEYFRIARHSAATGKRVLNECIGDFAIIDLSKTRATLRHELMSINPPSTLHLSQKSRYGLWRRLLVASLALLPTLVLAVFALAEWVAHRPSPVRGVISPAEIRIESERLARSGLLVRDESLLREHPFAPPWTAHSLLVPPNWLNESRARMVFGSHRVRADWLLSDLDVLEPVMQRAYGGWDSAALRGWNWSAWFDNWRKELRAKGSKAIPWNEAFAPIDALIAFQRDNHTQIPLKRRSTIDSSQTALLVSAPPGPCTQIRASGRIFSITGTDAAKRVRTALLWTARESSIKNTNYLALPQSYGVPQAVACGGTWIALQPIGNEAHGAIPRILKAPFRYLQSERPHTQRLGGGVVYARLPTFNEANYANLRSDHWVRRQPGDRILLIDLRDNGGGSASYGFAALKGWIPDDRMVPARDFGIRLNASCLYAPLKWNASAGTSPNISPNLRAYLQSLLDRMAEQYPPGCPRVADATPPRWTYPQHHFRPQTGDMRIIALVNAHCASDCELFTAQLASLRETIVVGVNTDGVGQFVQPGYSVLPHTGLAYRIALGESDLYGDGRSFDGYGLDVDLVLPDVNDAQLNELQKLAETVSRM